MTLQTFFKSIAILLMVAIIALSVVPAEIRPDTRAPHNFEHGAIFLLLGLTMQFGYRMGYWIGMIWGPIFSAAIEVVQIGVPGRHARMEDFVVDAASIVAGFVVAALLLKLQARRLL